MDAAGVDAVQIDKIWIQTDECPKEPFTNGVYNPSRNLEQLESKLLSASAFPNISSENYHKQVLFERDCTEIACKTYHHHMTTGKLICQRLKESMFSKWVALVIEYPKIAKSGLTWFQFSRSFNFSVIQVISRYCIYAHTNRVVHGKLLESLFVRKDGSLCLSLADNSNNDFTEELLDTEVEILWKFMYVAGNGYHPSSIAYADLMIDQTGFNADVPQFFKDFCQHIRQKSYKRFDVRASLNPTFVWDANVQFDQLQTLRKYLASDPCRRGLFDREFGTWIPMLEQGPSECNLVKFYEYGLDNLQKQKKAIARGEIVHGIPAPDYADEACDVLRFLRNAVAHIFKALNWSVEPTKDDILDLFNSRLNLCWRLFEASLEVSVLGNVNTVEFLKAIGLYANM